MFHLHGVFLALQFTGDELQCAPGNVVPQVAALLDASVSGFGKCVALVQLQVVASAIEGDHFVERGRVGATLPRDILIRCTEKAH